MARKCWGQANVMNSTFPSLQSFGWQNGCWPDSISENISGVRDSMYGSKSKVGGG
jgi:hypothetical protein